MSTSPLTKTSIGDSMTSIESTPLDEKVSEDLKTSSSTTELVSVTSFPYKIRYYIIIKPRLS